MVIYKIICIQTNKVYVGLSRKFEQRKKKHLSLLKYGRHFNKYLQNAYDKYGKDSFVFEKIEDVKDEKILGERERFYIGKYKSNDSNFGFNLNEGGDESNIKFSDQAIEKLKIFNTGKKLSEEHKKKIGEANKGKQISEEQRKNISSFMKEWHKSGRGGEQQKHLRSHKRGEFKHSVSSKKKIGLARLGKTYEEIFGKIEAKRQKEKRSISSKGDKNGFYKFVDITKIKTLIDNGKKLDEIKSILNCSKPTLLSKFKQKYGISIQQYKNSIRSRN